MKKRIWLELEIGTNPDSALALYFALKHKDLDVVGVSVSGSPKSLEARLSEAKSVLEYADKPYTPLYLANDVESQYLTALNIDHTIVNGPLTNTARLVLEEAELGQLNIRAGAFSKVNYRGNPIEGEENIVKDLDAARIVFSQYENVVISSFDASNKLEMSLSDEQSISKKHQFFKSRFKGFHDHLIKTHDEKNCRMILHAMTPLADILNLVGITREVIEFKIQGDGTLFSSHFLTNITEPIVKYESSDPTPMVTHEVIRTLNAQTVFEELLETI